MTCLIDGADVITVLAPPDHRRSPRRRSRHPRADGRHASEAGPGDGPGARQRRFVHPARHRPPPGRSACRRFAARSRRRRRVIRALRAQATFESWTDRADRRAALRCGDDARRTRGGTGDRRGQRDRDSATCRTRRSRSGLRASASTSRWPDRSRQGPLSVDADRQVTEIASPVGVVFGVVPVTNPVATAIFKMLIALKGRNALILSFHHHAARRGTAAPAASSARC